MIFDQSVIVEKEEEEEGGRVGGGCCQMWVNNVKGFQWHVIGPDCLCQAVWQRVNDLLHCLHSIYFFTSDLTGILFAAVFVFFSFLVFLFIFLTSAADADR